MAASNQAYNRSYKPVNEKRAFAERSKLRERLDKVYDRLKFKRQEERNLMGDVWQAELRVQQLQHEQDTLRQVVQELGRHKEEALAAVHVRTPDAVDVPPEAPPEAVSVQSMHRKVT